MCCENATPCTNGGGTKPCTNGLNNVIIKGFTVDILPLVPTRIMHHSVPLLDLFSLISDEQLIEASIFFQFSKFFKFHRTRPLERQKK